MRRLHLCNPRRRPPRWGTTTARGATRRGRGADAGAGAARLAAVVLTLATLAACTSGSSPATKPSAASGPAPHNAAAPVTATEGRFTATPAGTHTRLHVNAPYPSLRALDGLRQLTRAGFIVGVPLQVSTPDAIPAGGIKLQRSYAVPLPEDAVATWAFYNTAAGAWQAATSEISPDRRTVTATVHHLSQWTNLTAIKDRGVAETYTAALNAAGQAVDAAEHVLTVGAGAFHDWASAAVDDVIAAASNVADWLYYQLGKVVDTRVNAPACTGPVPYWVGDVSYPENSRNNPLLFCAGHDPKHPDLLVLKARVNRGFAFTAHLAGPPDWMWNSTMDPGLLKVVRQVVDLPTSMELPAQELTAGTATLVGPGEELDVGLNQDMVQAAGSEDSVLDLRGPSVLVFLVSMLSHLATQQGLDSDASWVSAAVAVAHCANDVSQSADIFTAARAVLTCLGTASDDIGKQIARAMLDAGKSVTQVKAAAALTARMSIYLALIGPVFNSMNYFAQTQMNPSVGQVHVTIRQFKPTQRIVLNPFTSTGTLKPGFSFTRSQPSGNPYALDCSFDQASPNAVSPDTHWCGSTADNSFACWPDPHASMDLACMSEPWTGQLWRRTTTGFGNTSAPKNPQPLGIETVDGRYWSYRIGGAWDASYPGTVPRYGCVLGCSNEEIALVGDDQGTVDTSGSVWRVREGEMASPGTPLPKPVWVPVAKAWYISTQ